MHAWIFQALRDRFDLSEPSLSGDGPTVTWYATRYRDRMAPGDVVYFWQAGPEDVRGIYAWGRLASAPYMKPGWRTFGVDVRIAGRIEPHISVEAIRRQGALADLLILRAPQATNFLISMKEAHAIASLAPASVHLPPEVR